MPNQDTPADELTPREQLWFDIETERIMAAATGPSPLSPEETARANEEVRRVLKAQGLFLKPESGPPTPSSLQITSLSLRIEPIATMAAADAVTAIVRWDAGEVRLLRSMMRSDLAVEVLVDPSRQAEFDGVVFFVEVTESTRPVAVFAAGSPVFCGVEAQDLIHGAPLALGWASEAGLGQESLPALNRSLNNLRDPSDLDRYDDLIGRIENA
jgi:hypothetical protein